ncbi:MAG TPA: NB-ARC domain-containing protein, partial [Mycobacterium sp.]
MTVTGVGGVGKTRLALQVAADVLPFYRDGAWLVELAPVRDSADVVAAVISAFRAANVAGQSSEDSLVEMLAQKQLLLVLDNCEHLLGPVAGIVSRIERECPGLVVLATSREGMAIEGEQLIALPPLTVAEPGEDVERLLQADAINLFLQRAQQVKADFSLNPDNAASVVEVCRRLDGVPLAIELAAARVIAMSPIELVARLDRRFQVLAGARRGAVERHATLRAAIDWSYDLLTEAEQRLLARMSVFSGGCTLDAIEDVCGGDPVDTGLIMDLVAGLVARSLVVAEDGAHGTRYRMLETIRQYAEERLTDWDETTTLTIRHGRFYTALCERANQNYYGPEQLEWARRIKVEHDNIRSALGNAVDSGNTQLAVQIIASHPIQDKAEGPSGEVVAIPALPVLELPGVTEEPGYPLALLLTAYDMQAKGDWEAVSELCRQAIEAERHNADSKHGHRIEMDTRSLYAQKALAAGAYADAVIAYDRAAELALADGNAGLAGIFLAYGVQCADLGGIARQAAVAKGERAVALARRSGMAGAIVLTLNALALALVDEDPARARTALRESIDRATTPGQEVSSGLLTASLVASKLRDWRLTLAVAVRSMRLWRFRVALMQSAPSLALCARALAEDRPDVAAVLRGAAYTAFSQANPGAAGSAAAVTPEA